MRGFPNLATAWGDSLYLREQQAAFWQTRCRSEATRTGGIGISAESAFLTYFGRFMPRVVGMDD